MARKYGKYGYRYAIWRLEGKDPQFYAVVDAEAMQFASVHIYEDKEEATKVLQQLLESEAASEHWPDWNDSEVVNLANSKAFRPRPQENVDTERDNVYRRHEAARVIALKRAGWET